ncbi:DegQ family serine endoprotease [Chelativorans sp. M5D2P16]|uniref:DegQ family serine endoprotease n=1 Tax=Chelativorans sp. M5D2P16 TaxID=3095678 RepID=UPI002ACA6F11|nr:DegQ family serine endoprotease [Chelativorans sp. M5D2P16]MDZ5697601.1 DegQ family serine endoprotease [Chelativorans sp. M5D2P16]
MVSHVPFVRFCTTLLISALVAGAPPSAFAQQADERGNGLLDFLRGTQTGSQETGSETPARRVPFSQRQIQLSFAPLVRETAPAVVNVYASARVDVRSPFMGDPFFERFFSFPQMPPRVRSSLGSGVLVDPSGLVVTNYHVIREADEVKVALADGREFESEILLKDERLDLAVLKIEGADPFPAARFGDSEALEVGDLVLAIGNPFGVGQTTTSGIVSALARTPSGISDFGFFIQTDAAINPGNSGGALINMSGEVVGINTAIYSRSGGSNGIGFAIPANVVRSVVEAAKSGADHFARPYVGASFDRVTPDIAEALGMERPAGALVTDVAPESPAARAGLKAADVVVGVKGKAVDTPEALDYRLATLPVGEPVEIEIVRDGERERLSLPIERAPETATEEVQIGGQGPLAGARVAALSPVLAQQLNLPIAKKGIVVVAAARNSPAASIGLRPGDIIRALNGEEIESVEQLQRAAEADTRWWRFTIDRNGRMISQTMRF